MITFQVDRRIIIDGESHPEANKLGLSPIYENTRMSLISGLIKQEPSSSKEPPGGHIPLPLPGEQPRRPYHPPPPLPADMPIGPPVPMGLMGKRGNKKKIRGPPPPPPPAMFFDEDEDGDDIDPCKS